MGSFMLTRRHFLGGALSAALPGCGGGDEDPFPPEPGPGPVPAPNSDLAVGELDGRVADLMSKTGVPGVAVAVVRGDQTIYAKGFGVRDLRSDGRVDADTVFQLASVSKSIGATAVAHQVGLGQIRWNQPMHELLPWFLLSDPEASRLLTVADLYAHRSGLPGHIGDHLEDLGYSQREVLERLRHVPLDGFRTKYAYTNFGLTAAGVAVAEKAGLDWATLNEQVLYRPLGMHRTSSRFSDFMQRDNRVVGHRKTGDQWGVNTLRMPDAQAPAASVTSSVNELAKWLSMLLGKGVYQGRRIVDAAALAPVLSPQMQTDPAKPNSHYGFGFNVGLTHGGRRLYSHSGAFGLGAATAFNVLPSSDLGIVVLTNGYPVGLPEVLCVQFVDLLEFGAVQNDDYLGSAGEYFAKLNAPQGVLVDQTPPASPVPPGPLSDYVGQYHNDFYGPLQIDLVDGALQLTLGAAPLRLPLQHWDAHVFTFRPLAENASPGSISQASFAGREVTLEIYDDPRGLGSFVRAS